MDGAVSVKTGPTSGLVFRVTGTQTFAYAQAFANTIDSLPASSFMSIGGSSPSLVPGGGSPTVYVGTGANSFDTMISGAYVVDVVNNTSTITGAGDTVLSAGINSGLTFNATGGSNEVIFVDGNNKFVGSNSDTKDLIVAGSGFDTVVTGSAPTTVISGTGRGTFYLNDALNTGSAGFGDVAYLGDGNNIVHANGAMDMVFADASGQTILGGGASTSALDVVLNTGSSNDMVGLGNSFATIFDLGNNNQIYGGAGLLVFVGGENVSASINGGSSFNLIFGNSGDNLVYNAQTSQVAPSNLIAGTGNETLYGGTSTGDQVFWGYAGDSTNPMTNESLVGGSGNDTMITGSGNETLDGGAGTNLFIINNDSAYTGNTNILVQDFGASATNQVAFSGYSQSQINDALQNASVGSNSITLTLGNSTVTFVGVTSLNGHIV